MDNQLVAALMERDDLTLEEALEVLEEARLLVADSEDPEEVLATSMTCFEVWHVEPINDLREHVTDGWAYGLRCWCNPTVQEDGCLVIHHALDQREKYETGELKLH